MRVTKRYFGTTRGGEQVTLFHLENKKGSFVELLDYGCIVRALSVPDRHGRSVDVVLGYDELSQYETEDGYLGAAVGRHANRIGQGRFTLNDKDYQLAVNNGPNHLHGGTKGFDRYLWASQFTDDSIVFSRLSPDGEEGYPGDLQLTITYHFSEDNTLGIHYQATCDADTVINLTNHSYFNLEGVGNILSHRLQIFAAEYTPNDSNCLPTGVISTVEGTPMDFRLPKEIGRDIATPWNEVRQFGGYDHNFVLAGTGPKRAALLHAPMSGISMETCTTLPGVQCYTANSLTPRRGKADGWYDVHHGVCLETQFFPNAMAFQSFPSPVLKAGKTYDQTTSYRFFTE